VKNVDGMVGDCASKEDSSFRWLVYSLATLSFQAKEREKNFLQDKQL